MASRGVRDVFSRCGDTRTRDRRRPAAHVVRAVPGEQLGLNGADWSCHHLAQLVGENPKHLARQLRHKAGTIFADNCVPLFVTAAERS